MHINGWLQRGASCHPCTSEALSESSFDVVRTDAGLPAGVSGPGAPDIMKIQTGLELERSSFMSRDSCTHKRARLGWDSY